MQVKSELTLAKYSKYTFILFFISIFFFQNCSEETPVSEEKFIQVYVDLLIGRDTISVQSSSFDSLKTRIFTKHSISSEDYYSTLEYYKSYSEKWEELFDRAITYAEKLKDDSAK